MDTFELNGSFHATRPSFSNTGSVFVFVLFLLLCFYKFIFDSPILS